jgi:hypothetical protein
LPGGGGLYIETEAIGSLLILSWMAVASIYCNLCRRISECLISFLSKMAVPPPGPHPLSDLYGQ